MKNLCLALLCWGQFVAVAAGRAEPAFALRDGDRVVLVGSTLIEREQRYGYWETALTRRYPDQSITFRNLGWSGDTVFGDARAGFGTQADGFRQLKEHVLALKPTVLIIGYGTNESFAGPKGLPHFVKGLETLLDTFAPTKARVVLLSPLKQENLGPPLPDPAANNKNLRLYADAIRDVAKKRGHLFVDLYELLGKEKHHLTDDGIQLTGWGYWRSATVLERGLGLPVEREPMESKVDEPIGQEKTERKNGDKDGRALSSKYVTVSAKLDNLPLPPPPPDGAPKDFRWRAPLVKIKGKEPLSLDADLKQSEQLRMSIVAKNRLYFYRWRPENETYLFGFRKHEQGQNAREIPQFDPLIGEKEKEIAKLRAPVAHTYELKAEKKP